MKTIPPFAFAKIDDGVNDGFQETNPKILSDKINYDPMVHGVCREEPWPDYFHFRLLCRRVFIPCMAILIYTNETILQDEVTDGVPTEQKKNKPQ